MTGCFDRKGVDMTGVLYLYSIQTSKVLYRSNVIANEVTAKRVFGKQSPPKRGDCFVPRNDIIFKPNSGRMHFYTRNARSARPVHANAARHACIRRVSYRPKGQAKMPPIQVCSPRRSRGRYNG